MPGQPVLDLREISTLEGEAVRYGTLVGANKDNAPEAIVAKLLGFLAPQAQRRSLGSRSFGG